MISGISDLEREFNTKRFFEIIENFPYDEKNKTTLKNLILEGIQLGKQDKFGRTPLRVAVVKKYIEIAQLLLDRGANLEIDQVPLHRYCYVLNKDRDGNVQFDQEFSELQEPENFTLDDLVPSPTLLLSGNHQANEAAAALDDNEYSSEDELTSGISKSARR
ncbi:ankyrin repeat domain-containing protein [Candidatus Berkiella aquae]|uniref:Ankyrin repeat domain-containing protein n=1 Tax=Candidatus Berkiella aquae TaxID=295108 RepID=A0A0Q9YKI3_9GAMM|nr:ankyrin repeat domain-containing protein [Candidatus Berkiella aquae]MCS5711212.1 ankyrin repeat domain-containing protein [Candidatus Berkiella aquae]